MQNLIILNTSEDLKKCAYSYFIVRSLLLRKQFY